jgi:type II secretory pathway pseudopilin PulG
MVMPSQHRQRGAGFLALLLVIAAMSAAAATAAQWTSAVMQREREAQLLWAGVQIQRALLAYAQTAPDELRRYPRSLDELLLDTRATAPRRHLRRVYEDPMASDGQWALVRDNAGRIVGVHSRSMRAPMKRSRFAAEAARFEKASTYTQWVFGVPAAFDVVPRRESATSATEPRSDDSSHPNR